MFKKLLFLSVIVFLFVINIPLLRRKKFLMNMFLKSLLLNVDFSPILFVASPDGKRVAYVA